MKLLLTLVTLFFMTQFSSQAQDIEVSGRVMVEGSKSPIEFATIKLLDKESGSLLVGTTTKPDGGLLLITQDKTFNLEISFIGFISKTITEYEINNGKVLI